jgi:hypothetical protein
MRRVLLLALLADVSPRTDGGLERRWREGDWVIASNDPLKSSTTSGDVVGLQIAGRGESCMIRRARHRLRFPTRVAFRIRWTEAGFTHAYPSVHVLLDPPALDDAWWEKPIGNPAWGRWSAGLKVFVFHYSNDGSWRQHGVSDAVESADGHHDYSSAKGEWARIEIRLEADRIEVHADGKKVAETKADLSAVRHFTFGFGDQTSTRVEVDEVALAHR